MFFLLSLIEAFDLMRTLFPFLAFDPVETPLSFATRLAMLHTGGRLAPFLNDLGIKPTDLAGGDSAAVDRLCALAGVDPGAVWHNTARRVASRRFEIRGEPVSSFFFSSPNTAFCPACLRADDASGQETGQRRGRLSWTLRPVRTCPDHEIPLIHRDRVRWDDQFQELDELVPERGADLDALVARCARRPVSSLQNYVTARLDGRCGPTWLDAQTIEQAVRATEMLGVLLAFGPRTALRSLAVSDWDHAGHVGYEFTVEGESGIRTALEDARRAADTKRRPGRKTTFGCFYEWLASTEPHQEPGNIKRILRAHIFNTMEIGENEEVLGMALDRRRLHSVESLARETNLDPRTLGNLLVARGLISKADAGRGYEVFDAETGRKIAAQVRRSMTIRSLPRALNCTRPLANQLLDERLLTPLSRNLIDTPGRARKSVEQTEIDRFLAILHAQSRSVEMVPDDFVPIAKAAEKARVSAGEIVQMILAGFLGTVVRKSDTHGCAALFVDPAEVRAKFAGCMPGLSPITAFSACKIPVAVGWALADRRTDPRIPKIDITGPTGHRLSRFRERDIAEFTSRFTTIGRIADVSDLPQKQVEARLKAARVQPEAAFHDIGFDVYRVETLPHRCSG